MSNRKLDHETLEKGSYLDIALRARETLKNSKGWCQLAMTNHRGQHCVIGHVELVVGNFFVGTGYEQGKKLFNEMGVYETGLHGAVIHNNSHTHAEVLSLFDKGIETLMEKHYNREDGKS